MIALPALVNHENHSVAQAEEFLDTTVTALKLFSWDAANAILGRLTKSSMRFNGDLSHNTPTPSEQLSNLHMKSADLWLESLLEAEGEEVVKIRALRRFTNLNRSLSCVLWVGCFLLIGRDVTAAIDLFACETHLHMTISSDFEFTQQ